MSLEATIERNTQAIEALIQALSQGISTTSAQVAAVVKEAPKAKVKEAPKAETKKSSAAASPEQPTPTAAASSEPSLTGVKYETLRNLVIKLAPGNREGVRAITARHGLTKVSALLSDENNFESVIDHAKLEALYNDMLTLAR
jgi:hypothetical protein